MPPPRAVAVLVARLLLGLTFFMAGWWKVFRLGAVEHAGRLFVGPYAETFLPGWTLWAAGTAIPFVELVGGAMLLLGWRRRLAAAALGAVLVVVTFGHLLLEPLYALHEHVLPRALLLVIVLVFFDEDRFSLARLLARRRR